MAHADRPTGDERGLSGVQRFHVAQTLQAGCELAFSAAQARQIARVLRLAPGASVEVFDGAGGVAEVELQRVSAERVLGTVLAARRVPWPDPWRPVLYLASVRPQRFEWAVEKAVELGACTIVPLLCERVTHGEGGRSERRQRIAVEAAEQCGSAYVPLIELPVDLPAALRRPAALRLLALERAGVVETVGEAVAALAASGGEPPKVALFVGPEGGFSGAERAAAEAAGCRMITLGSRILRSETAALTLLAQLAEAALRRDGV